MNEDIKEMIRRLNDGKDKKDKRGVFGKKEKEHDRDVTKPCRWRSGRKRGTCQITLLLQRHKSLLRLCLTAWRLSTCGVPKWLIHSALSVY